MTKSIRKAIPDDLPGLFEIYAAARSFMREHGNPDQWGETHPSNELVAEDVRLGRCFVCTEGGRIECVFCCMQWEEPTYSVIEGHWLNELPYAVIHRIASAPGTKGAAYFSIQWALRQFHNVRIDTHEKNTPMRHLIDKLKFHYCGIIHVEDGSPRRAYQLCIPG